MTTHMSLSVFGYNEGTKEMIGPLFQVEKALHTIEMDIICTLKMFPLFILIYLKQSNNLYVFLFQWLMTAQRGNQNRAKYFVINV